MLSTLRAHKPSYTTVGIVASVPILAVAQGAYFLTNFRRNHGDAPYPVSPSRGIVIVSPQDGNGGNNHNEQEQQGSHVHATREHSNNDQLHMKNLHDKWLSTWKRINIINRKNNQRRANNDKSDGNANGFEGTAAAAEEEESNPNNPLRIFVVGDSLAAGVGSTKGTPVLPEAIARSLSKALGGRPVHWTCHGTPGASTSRIMKDIQEFTSDDYDSLITDQQQKEHDKKQKKDYNNNSGHDGDGDGGESDREKLGVQWKELKEVIIQHVKIVIQSLRINNRLLPSQRRSMKEKDEKDDNNSSSQEHDVEQTNFKNQMTIAISESRSKIDQKLQEIIHTLQHNIQRPFRRHLRRSNEDGDHDDEKAIWNQWNTNLSRSTILKRKDMAQYDVVIVLTGLNDLKGLFLPWMQDKDAMNSATFKEELRKVFYFLTGKKYQEQQSIKQKAHRHIVEDEEDENRALVVLPALPTRVLPMLQYPPLCWIIHTLFDLIDEEKRALSKEYPGSLLFIEAPTIEMIDEIEKGEYFLVTKRKTETVLLALKDVTMRVRSEMEGLMKKHIKKHDFKDNEKEIELHYEASKHHNLTDSMPDAVGSKLVSIDKIHPNDDGYDFWGRHIAEGIIEELKLKNKRC